MNTSTTFRCLQALLHHGAMTLCIVFSFLSYSLQAGSAAPVASPSVQRSMAASITAPDPYTVYLLDENGNPVAQPNACIQQPAIYTDTTLSVLVGYIDPSTDNIVDAYGNVLGYISPSGGGVP